REPGERAHHLRGRARGRAAPAAARRWGRRVRPYAAVEYRCGLAASSSAASSGSHHLQAAPWIVLDDGRLLRAERVPPRGVLAAGGVAPAFATSRDWTSTSSKRGERIDAGAQREPPSSQPSDQNRRAV